MALNDLNTLINTLILKSTGGNAIPVDRITLKREEFTQVIGFLKELKLAREFFIEE
jgi:hypothetical protein